MELQVAVLKLPTIGGRVQGCKPYCAIKLWQASYEVAVARRFFIRIARAALLHGSKLREALSKLKDKC